VEGATGQIRILIPVSKQNDVEKDINKLIFSSLVKYDNKGKIIGDLAKNWEVTDGGKRYIFHLQKAKWHDGTEVKADDVLFTISLISKMGTKNPFYESFRDIKVEKDSQDTVAFLLPAPLSSFLDSLTVPILPQHLLGQTPPDQIIDSSFAQKPIGSGPYLLEKIERHKKETKVILQANKDYFSQKPNIDKIIFRLFATEEEAQNAFAQKQISGLLQKTNHKNNSHKITIPQYKAIFFNFNSPRLDKKTRVALSQSVNKQEIINQIEGTRIINSPILPDYLSYQGKENWIYDPQKAKDNLSKSKNTDKNLTLLTTQNPDNQKIVRILKKNWEEELGLRITVNFLNNHYFEKELSARNFDLLLAGVDQKGDPDPYPLWHSSQIEAPGLNFSCFKNKEADKLLEEARQSLNEEARKEKYKRFIDIIQEETAAIFLYQPIYYYQLNGRVAGIEDIQSSSKSDRFWNIEKWRIKEN